MRGNRMPVVIGTSISLLTSNATWRSTHSSAQTERTCAFQPESVSTLARRTRAASRMAFSRHRARKKKAPAIHTPSKSLGKNDGITLTDAAAGVVCATGAASEGIVEVEPAGGAATAPLAGGGRVVHYL